jgi:hypothetical protein
MSVDEIESIVNTASSNHILGYSTPEYSDGFIEAFRRVYSAEKWRRVLQHKFFLPDESKYSDERFFAHACELSIANHITLQTVRDFDTEKNVNPTNGTNIDVFFRRGATVSIEVKCPVQPRPDIPTNPKKDVMLLKTAGRICDYKSEISNLISSIGSSGAMTAVSAKNKDATLKTCLIEANEKFNPQSSVNDLNILFVANGDWADMADYYTYLYGINELFTAQPFYPADEFRQVDVVILSSLRYRHEHVRQCDDWTLGNVFILPS